MTPSHKETVKLSLPFPPSANALWRAVGGRNIVSEPYRVWKREAAQVAAISRCGRLSGPYAITIVADRPDNRRRDLANLEKATSDLLVSSGIIADDCDAQKLILVWSDREPGKGAEVHVTLTKWGG